MSGKWKIFDWSKVAVPVVSIISVFCVAVSASFVIGGKLQADTDVKSSIVEDMAAIKTSQNSIIATQAKSNTLIEKNAMAVVQLATSQSFIIDAQKILDERVRDLETGG